MKLRGNMLEGQKQVVVFVFVQDHAIVNNSVTWMDLSHKSMLERRVLKNGIPRTSQRLKRPSGARVMTCSQSLGRSIARSLARAGELFRRFDSRITDMLRKSLRASMFD